MIKKLTLIKLIALLALIAIPLVGCMPTDNGTNTPSGPVTIQWWGVYWDESVVSSLISEYEQQNQNVKIEYANKWPGGNREIAAKLYQDELERVLKENNPVSIPDIFMVENTWAQNYERYVAPAPSSVIDINTVKTAFYPAAVTDFAQNNVVRGLPLWMDSLAVIYNKKLLAEKAVSTPPDDWVDFKNLAISLTERTGSTITQAGFAAGTAGNVSFATEVLNLLMLQNGVNMVNAQGKPSFSTDSDSAGALSFYQSFGLNNGTWNSSLKNDAIAFLEGDVAMLVVPAWRYHEILRFNKLYNLGLDIGVAPMPQLQGQPEPKINWATYWGAMVSLNRPATEESWKFLNWLTQPEQLRKLRANESLQKEFFGFIYPRQDMQTELQTDQYLRVYNSALPSAKSWPMVDGLAVREVFIELINSSGGTAGVSRAENEIADIVENKGNL